MRLCFALALLAAACGRPSTSQANEENGQQSGQQQPVDAVTAVTVTASSPLKYLASETLTASVQGTGTFSQLVTWTIQSGGGTLSATTGASVTYKAPLATASSQAVIYASSASTPAVFGSATIDITPAPPPAMLVAGTYDVGFEDEEYQPSPAYGQPPVLVNTVSTAGKITIVPVDDSTAIVYGRCDDFPDAGFPMVVNSDGTFTTARFNCPALDIQCSQYIGSKQRVIRHGSGTWDYAGRLTLEWFTELDFCGGVGFDQFTSTAVVLEP